MAQSAAALVYSPIYDMMVPAQLMPEQDTSFASIPGYIGFTGVTDVVPQSNPLQILGGGLLNDADYRAQAARQGYNELQIGNAIARRSGKPEESPPAPHYPIWGQVTDNQPMPPIPTSPADFPHILVTPPIISAARPQPFASSTQSLYNNSPLHGTSVVPRPGSGAGRIGSSRRSRLSQSQVHFLFSLFGGR